jgi:hypothetical protein
VYNLDADRGKYILKDVINFFPESNETEEATRGGQEGVGTKEIKLIFADGSMEQVHIPTDG